MKNRNFSPLRSAPLFPHSLSPLPPSPLPIISPIIFLCLGFSLDWQQVPGPFYPSLTPAHPSCAPLEMPPATSPPHTSLSPRWDVSDGERDCKPEGLWRTRQLFHPHSPRDAILCGPAHGAAPHHRGWRDIPDSGRDLFSRNTANNKPLSAATGQGEFN